MVLSYSYAILCTHHHVIPATLSLAPFVVFSSCLRCLRSTWPQDFVLLSPGMWAKVWQYSPTAKPSSVCNSMPFAVPTHHTMSPAQHHASHSASCQPNSCPLAIIWSQPFLQSVILPFGVSCSCQLFLPFVLPNTLWQTRTYLMLCFLSLTSIDLIQRYPLSSSLSFCITTALPSYWCILWLHFFVIPTFSG